MIQYISSIRPIFALVQIGRPHGKLTNAKNNAGISDYMTKTGVFSLHVYNFIFSL